MGWLDWLPHNRIAKLEEERDWYKDRLLDCREKADIPKPQFRPPSRYEIITSAQMAGIMSINRFRNVGVTDSKYVLISKEDFEAWLEYDQVDKEKYILHAYDCDNFAHDLVTFYSRYMRETVPEQAGQGLGELWITKPMHAISMMVDINREVHIYEPQSDRPFIINEAADKYRGRI